MIERHSSSQNCSDRSFLREVSGCFVVSENRSEVKNESEIVELAESGCAVLLASEVVMKKSLLLVLMVFVGWRAAEPASGDWDSVQPGSVVAGGPTRVAVASTNDDLAPFRDLLNDSVMAALPLFGVTFPFNITLGFPIYMWIATATGG